MLILAILSLIAGLLLGYFFLNPQFLEIFSSISEVSLYILMISVGITVGANKLVFKKLRQYNLTVLLIPVGIILGSVLSGFVCALILKMPLNSSVCIVSGLGWYSLSGVLLTDLFDAQTGTIAFLSNLIRELTAFALIPLIVKYFNPYTAIAPAGATSEDTTLPMLIKYTSEDVVVLSVLNGIICSAAVPILIGFFNTIL